MTPFSKILTAVSVATVAALAFVVPLAGAQPWYCRLAPGTGTACRVIHVANDTGKTVSASAAAVEHTADATASAAGLLEKGTKAVADGMSWANDTAGNFHVPTKLQPGECVDTSAGRWCAPVAEKTSTTPTTVAPAPVLVPYCYVTKTGARVCVR